MKVIPSWAVYIVRNYRNQAGIPQTISDYDLYRVLVEEDIELIDTPEEQTEIIRQTLGLSE